MSWSTAREWPADGLGPTLWLVSLQEAPLMHYPRRISNIKRVRKLGFRARMKTKLGRKMINRKRRMGRQVAAA